MFKLESQKLVKLNGIENRVRNSVACTEFENAADPPGGQPEPRAAGGPGRLGLLPPGQPESQQPVTHFRAVGHSVCLVFQSVDSASHEVHDETRPAPA